MFRTIKYRNTLRKAIITVFTILYSFDHYYVVKSDSDFINTSSWCWCHINNKQIVTSL